MKKEYILYCIWIDYEIRSGSFSDFFSKLSELVFNPTVYISKYVQTTSRWYNKTSCQPNMWQITKNLATSASKTFGSFCSHEWNDYIYTNVYKQDYTEICIFNFSLEFCYQITGVFPLKFTHVYGKRPRGQTLVRVSRCDTYATI